MENVFDFIWREFSDMFNLLVRIMPDSDFGKNFDFDKVSEHDKQIIKELSQRMAYALFFSEVDDGKEVL